MLYRIEHPHFGKISKYGRSIRYSDKNIHNLKPCWTSTLLSFQSVDVLIAIPNRTTTLWNRVELQHFLVFKVWMFLSLYRVERPHFEIFPKCGSSTRYSDKNYGVLTIIPSSITDVCLNLETSIVLLGMMSRTSTL